MRTRKRRMMPALTAAALLFCLTPSGDAASAAPQARTGQGEVLTAAGYTLTAEDSGAALYAMPQTGSFIFLDKKSGKQWFSSPPDSLMDESTFPVYQDHMRSQILVEYVDMRTASTSIVPTVAVSHRECVQTGTFKVREIKNGFRVEYSFENEKIFIPLEFTLKGGALSAVIKTGEIRESGHNHISAVHFLPGLTVGGKTENGYLFVPDGSGAVARLNNGKGVYDEDYDQPVYGADLAVEQDRKPAAAEQIAMPVFGIKTGAHALTGIIAKGAAESRIYAHISKEGFAFNRIYPKLILAVSDKTRLFEADYFNQRDIYRLEQRTQKEDYEVLYFPLSGDAAGYTGMAAQYRSYLLAHDALKQNAAPPTLNVELYGAAEKKATFLGIPYQKQFALTTFSQAREILDRLREYGADQLTVRYNGWANGGLTNKKMLKSAKPISILGGKKGWQELDAYLSQAGGLLYAETDFVTFQKSGNQTSVLSDSAVSLFNTRIKKYEYLLSVQVSNLKISPWYLLKPSRYPAVSERFIRSYEKLDFRAGVSLSVAGKSLYSDFSRKTTATKTDTAAAVQAMMEAFDPVPRAVEYGNAYTYPYAQRIFKLPAGSTAYRMLDESVPFAQIVLHGYLPYSGDDLNRASDPERAFLKCIETGADPYYSGMYLDSAELMETRYNNLYSTRFSRWTKDAVEKFKEYQAVHKNLYDQTIISHARLSERVYRTVYEDGTAVYVNYGDRAGSADGLEIPPVGYAVKEGGERHEQAVPHD